ncbi:polysaccharide pyruvyl transferase family protein [Bifidobacterium imperatoris]|uniref:Polysaccharide pyruvyl transferase n=1 Tax=Bifidobacterium imperatoris TaxID=2020965 RepID=A0A2N5IRF2_9BIFI|nr:polysaccharide pyruvyl transferase family protein [Bifidobacterium imperatoris]PLS24544.1 polysaccharide pyruvyl transferase [Bifidobacterium imperatoris]QSY58074.1 polysaccharide pyruvyl transferase family protein [Bifidobacterium imperatoris]
MKVEVITLHSIKNYGSVLQTLATKEKFQSLGHDVEFINYVRKDTTEKNMYRAYTRNDNALKATAKHALLYPTMRRWRHVFGGFLDRNVTLTERMYTSEKQLEEHTPVADVYCTGSDQVWNSEWNQGLEEAFYLKFAPDEAKKIAYSASIGRDDFAEWEKPEVSSLLSRYDAISMREESAVEAVRNLGIENVCHVSDPTLQLDRAYWERLAAPPVVNENYVLIYQLNKSKQFDDYALRFAQLHHCKPVRLCVRYDQMRLPGSPVLIPEVEEFVSLIANAKYVITDSFHATAFSLNLNREVVCIYPKKFSSRLANILKATNMEHRHLTDYSQFDIADDPTDFDRVNHYFDQERANGDAFLQEALG